MPVTIYIAQLLVFHQIYSATTEGNIYCTLPCKSSAHFVCTHECKIGKFCDSTTHHHPITSEQREIIIEVHNKLRSSIALGQEKIFIEPTSASQMRRIEYSDELEYLAQCWGYRCILEAPECARSKKMPTLGINHFYGQIKEHIKVKDADLTKVVMQNWASGAFHLPMNATRTYYPEEIWHSYAQMILDETYLIGCAHMEHLFGRFYLCFYGPGRPSLGEALFKTGPHCSECSKLCVDGSKCGEGCKISECITDCFEGLCGTMNPPNNTTVVRSRAALNRRVMLLNIFCIAVIFLLKNMIHIKRDDVSSAVKEIHNLL